MFGEVSRGHLWPEWVYLKCQGSASDPLPRPSLSIFTWGVDLCFCSGVNPSSQWPSPRNCLPTVGLAEPLEARQPRWAEWHQERNCSARGLEAGELSALPILGLRGGGTEWLRVNTVYLGQPEHIPSPGCRQKWHETGLLCFEGCYDSQGICKPNQTWRRILSLAQRVSGSKRFCLCPLWHLPDGRLFQPEIWKCPKGKVISKLAEALLEGI